MYKFINTLRLLNKKGILIKLWARHGFKFYKKQEKCLKKIWFNGLTIYQSLKKCP